jgi:hypothetical protein
LAAQAPRSARHARSSIFQVPERLRPPDGSHVAPETAITYLKHLRIALWWPGFLAVFGGGVFALVRAIKGPGRVRWTLALIFPRHLLLLSRQSLAVGRYLLPLIPFVCILAATAIVSGVSLLRRFSIPRLPRTALIVALTVAVLLPPAIASVRFDSTLASRTAGDAFAWIQANVPEGSKIVIESNRLTLAAASRTRTSGSCAVAPTGATRRGPTSRRVVPVLRPVLGDRRGSRTR